MNLPPIVFTWEGDAMRPIHPRLADRHYVVGERYPLAPYEDRSQASHNHEFGWLAEAWKNLPEHMAERLPTPEHLRKEALIETGWFHEATVDAGSRAAALRVAAFMRADDHLARIVTRGPLVVKRVAMSQSRRAMGKEKFQKSKQDILEWISSQLGVQPEELLQARAA